MFRKLLVLGLGGVLMASPLVVSQASLHAQEPSGGKAPATLGVPGAPAYGVQGAPAYGAVVLIPAVIGATAGAGTTFAASGAPRPVLCMVEPTDAAVLAEANIPAGQKIAVIANTETACRAIRGTVTAAGGAPGAT